MELKQLTANVWYMPYEEERDRPNLGYVKGKNWSLAIIPVRNSFRQSVMDCRLVSCPKMKTTHIKSPFHYPGTGCSFVLFLNLTMIMFGKNSIALLILPNNHCIIQLH